MKTVLSNEEMERLRTFGLHSEPIPMLHVEAISIASFRECKKEVADDLQMILDTSMSLVYLRRCIRLYITEQLRQASEGGK